MLSFDRIVEAINQFLWDKVMRPRLDYLSESHDLMDLERRMRQLDIRRRFPG
jgi:Protein of unknown function (DUF3563)